MKRVMIDIETLGTSAQSVIGSIGAVEFGGGVVGAEFSEVVDVDTCLAAGLVMDWDTVRWWLRQPPEASKMWQCAGLPLVEALGNLSAWIGPGEVEVEVWAKGASFDFPILANAYRAVGLPLPWRYSRERCYRTMRALGPHVEKVVRGTAHDALDDARGQAVHLMEIEAAMGISVGRVG